MIKFDSDGAEADCRPEMKFGSLDALINRIRADTGLASKQLDLPKHAAFAQDQHFSE